ncbi:alternative cyclin pcl12 [Moniliophthora roreri]|nr:alternative cyclin pcl12 [Moniliophthora roreri]KAI3621073.1 alternative cyclin pcl12 [Moniliophthora roreri]
MAPLLFIGSLSLVLSSPTPDTGLIIIRPRQQSQAKLPYFIACILCCIELHFLESKCFYALAASGALFSVVAGGLNLEDFQLYSTRQ